MVRMFCDGGADVNALDSQGRTALHHLASYDSRVVTPTMEVQNNFNKGRLVWLYECTLWTIINAGADINLQDEWGKTPLHIAVERKESIMIKVLMEAGVNALIADNEGVRASKANRTAHFAPHTIEFKVLMLEMQ